MAIWLRLQLPRTGTALTRHPLGVTTRRLRPVRRLPLAVAFLIVGKKGKERFGLLAGVAAGCVGRQLPESGAALAAARALSYRSASPRLFSDR